MTLVVDASVAAKWAIEEDASHRAIALRDSEENFIAPSLIVAEIGNALWKRAIRQEMSAYDAVRALQSVVRAFAQLVPPSELTARAIEIAVELRHPIYDCFYLALAERERCALITADAKLIAAAKAVRGVEVRRL